MAVSSCTFYDDYIEHAIEDMFIFGQITKVKATTQFSACLSPQIF